MIKPTQAMLFACTFLLTACTTTATQTYSATGNTAFRIECGGFFGDGDTGSCYQKAGDICASQGYRILQTSTSSIIMECKTNEDLHDKSTITTQ